MSEFAQGAIVFGVGAIFGVAVYVVTPVIQQNVKESNK